MTDKTLQNVQQQQQQLVVDDIEPVPSVMIPSCVDDNDVPNPCHDHDHQHCRHHHRHHRRRSSVEIATLWNDLGNVCRDAGKYQQAHRYYHKALQLSSSSRRQHDIGESATTAAAASASATTASSSSSSSTSMSSHSSSSSLCTTSTTNNNNNNTLAPTQPSSSAAEGPSLMMVEGGGEVEIVIVVVEEDDDETELIESLSATLLGNLGLVASDLGNDEEALQCYVEALENLSSRRMTTSDHFDCTTTTTTTATIKGKGKHTTRSSNNKKNRERRKLRHLNVARTWNNLGTLYSKRGNYTEARKYYEQALDKYYETLSPPRREADDNNNNDDDFNGQTRNDEDRDHDSRGNTSTTNAAHAATTAASSTATTIRSFHSVMPTAVKTPDVAFTYHNIGNLCMDIGELEEAASYLEIALDIHRYCSSSSTAAVALTTSSTTTNNNSNTISKRGSQKAMMATLETLGELCVELGRYAKAIEYYQQVLDLQQQLQRQQQSNQKKKNTTATHSNDDETKEESIDDDDDDDAIDKAKESTTASSRNSSGQRLVTTTTTTTTTTTMEQDNEDMERTAGILGVLTFELSRYAQAKSYFQLALELHYQSAAAGTDDLAGTLDYLSQIERKLGQHEMARRYEEQAMRLLLAQEQQPSLLSSSKNKNKMRDPFPDEEKKETQGVETVLL